MKGHKNRVGKRFSADARAHKAHVRSSIAQDHRDGVPAVYERVWKGKSAK